MTTHWFRRPWVAVWLCAACPGDAGDESTGSTGGGASEPSGTTSAGTGGEATVASTPTTGAPGVSTTEGDDTSGGPAVTTGETAAEATSDPTSDASTGEVGESVTVEVHLVPQNGVAGAQRVNFAVPLRPGQLTDEAAITVRHTGTELPAALRGLARHPDGSWRSVQVQVDVEVAGETDLAVEVGAAPTMPGVPAVPVSETLIDDASGPRVWALLPAAWLTTSGFAGPLDTEAEAASTPGAAWASLCDYDEWNVDAFLGAMGQADVWLYDRGTIFYRGHARRGDLGTLRTAYLEAAIYLNGLTGQGPDTEIGVPGKTGDAKYYYSQGLALHFLMTGDDRFREGAEDVAEAYAALWADPGYAGGDDFWTERHAGFALLAYVWAMNVSDDQAEQLRGLADEAVAAYVEVQQTYPLGYDDAEARCFAHSDAAAGEDFGFFGCSPWLSAILADGLDQYATESAGAQAAAARASIVRLGRIVARDGLDEGGKPFYWMNVGNTDGAVDDYDEHWGESAYVVAMAYHHDGGGDAALATTATELIEGMAAFGSAPHMRSFNWQCRSAIATPWFLSP